MKIKRLYTIVPRPILHSGRSRSYAMDSCKVLLCMSGRVQGQGTVSGCSDAVTHYFSEPYKVYVYHTSGRTFIGPLPGRFATLCQAVRIGQSGQRDLGSADREQVRGHGIRQRQLIATVIAMADVQNPRACAGFVLAASLAGQALLHARSRRLVAVTNCPPASAAGRPGSRGKQQQHAQDQEGEWPLPCLVASCSQPNISGPRQSAYSPALA